MAFGIVLCNGRVACDLPALPNALQVAKRHGAGGPMPDGEESYRRKGIRTLALIGGVCDGRNGKLHITLTAAYVDIAKEDVRH